MKTKHIPLQHRRKREGRTNYRLRLKLLISKTPRLVVRKSLNNITVQMVAYEEDGDKVLASANSNALRKLGWTGSTGSVPAAYLTGYLLGSKAGKKKAAVDLGLQQSVKGGRLYAAVKGACDAGMDVACGEEMFPSEERLAGKHLKKEVSNEIKTIKEKIAVH